MLTNPKLFISYSWTSPEHEEKVLLLASELRESGVDVLLDKWELKEGHDAIVFMEQMVTDPEIKKVVMICDKAYAEKADRRSGGVGTESQIISKKVYESTDQNKFVAVVFEKDNNGAAFVPTYYQSRIHIDLSAASEYPENFEKLLRWIYDKPLYVKPELGTRPDFLDETATETLGTSASSRRAIEAIRTQKPFALGSLDEYFKTFQINLERFRLPQEADDDALIENIQALVPARNEFIGIVQTICQYGSDQEYVKKTHRFFENLLPYQNRPADVSTWRESDFDNFKFFIHELYLYALAISLKAERFDIVAGLFENYFIAKNAEYGQSTLLGFQVIRQHYRDARA